MVEEKPRPPIGTYHAGERQRCGLCNGLQWYIGRVVAECANEKCGNAIPLADIVIRNEGAKFTENMPKYVGLEETS